MTATLVFTAAVAVIAHVAMRDLLPAVPRMIELLGKDM